MSNLSSMTCQPPGFYIDLELQARGWSQEDLAYILDMDRGSVSKIIKGIKPISIDNAVLLADAFFGMDAMNAEFFTNLENQFRLSKAKQAPPSVKVKAR